MEEELKGLLSDSDLLKGALENQGLVEQFKEEVRKATEVKTTYQFSPDTRSIFSPENLDEKIKLLVPTDTPLRNRLPRTRGLGEATAWKVMTSRLHSNTGGAGVGTATTIVFADAGAPSETTQTYEMRSAPYKLLGRKLEVGGLAVAASRGRAGQPDMFEDRLRVKMYEVMLGEEELIIGGDDDHGTGLEFDGLGKQITTNSGNAALITASGIGVYCETLYGYGASPTLLVANARQIRALADELQVSGSIQRIAMTQTSAIGGVALSKIVNPIDGTLIDVKPDRYCGGNAFLLTEKSPAGESWIEMEDLIPMSRVDVPSSNYSVIAFVVEASVLKVLSEVYQYEIAGLALS